MTDAELTALFFARGEEAIDALDGKYGKLCRRLAERLLNDRQDAEECVNDAYLAVWNAVPPVEPEPWSAYVCKIVRNLALKRRAWQSAARRGGQCEVSVSMDELAQCLPAPGGVEAELEAGELVRAVETFLDTLSRENRAIFLGRYWFSGTYTEIGRQVGLTEKTVSVRLTRMRKQLKQYLTEREVLQ